MEANNYDNLSIVETKPSNNRSIQSIHRRQCISPLEMNSKIASEKAYRPKRCYNSAFTHYHNHIRRFSEDSSFPNDSTKRTRSVPPLIMTPNESHIEIPRPHFHNNKTSHHHLNSSSMIEYDISHKLVRSNNFTDKNEHNIVRPNLLVDEKDILYSPSPSPPQPQSSHLLSFEIVSQSTEHIEMVVRYGGINYCGVLMR